MSARHGLAAAGLLALAACAPAEPVVTVLPFQPTIAGRVTRGGASAAGRTVSLVRFTGRKENLYENQAPGVVTEAATDADGRYVLNVPLERVLADELFGVSYDPVAAQPGLRTQDTNPDEIRAFSTPAIWLHAKTGLSAEVSFDVAWDGSGFSPRFGDVVDAAVAFRLAPCAGATSYDLTVVRGSLSDQGDEAFFGRPTPTGAPALAWHGAKAGPYVWQARAYIKATSIPAITSFRVVSPAFLLSVGRMAGGPATVVPSQRGPSP
jgi:hypothetical protein